MVALSILGSVVALCASGLVAFRWKLTHKTETLSKEQEQRLANVESTLRQLHIVQGQGRTIVRSVG